MPKTSREVPVVRLPQNGAFPAFGGGSFPHTLGPGMPLAQSPRMNKNGSVLPDRAKSGGDSNHTPVMVPARRVQRVWVVDDNAALRALFMELLGKQPGIRCTREFPSAEAVLATLAEERPPDIILLDINLGGQSGLSAIRPIKKLAPTVKVVMLTMFSNSYYESEAFRAGASGFLLKSYELEEIVNLIHEVHRNPGAPQLFPSLSLRTKTRLAQEDTEPQSPEPARHLGLASAVRRLCGALKRQTAA